MIIAELYLVCCFLMSHYFTEGANVPWSRDDISACECDEKSYRHVHCPCFACDGRATDRKTELRHWKETSELAATNSAGVLNSDSTIHTFQMIFPLKMLQNVTSQLKTNLVLTVTRTNKVMELTTTKETPTGIP